MNAHHAARHIFGLIEIAGRIGNIDSRHPLGAAEEGLRARVVESATINIDVVIMKADWEGRSGYAPDAISPLGQRKALANANDDRLGVGGVDAESGLGFGIHLWIIIPRRVERRGSSIGPWLRGRGGGRGLPESESALDHQRGDRE